MITASVPELLAYDFGFIAVGGAFGYILGRVRRAGARPPSAPTPVGPVCQCTHGFAFHHPETGACQHTEDKYEKRSVPVRNQHGGVARDRWSDIQYQEEIVPLGSVACGCQRYTGPDPLPSVIDLA